VVCVEKEVAQMCEAHQTQASQADRALIEVKTWATQIYDDMKLQVHINCIV
jgi:hypothetical protein